MKSKSSNSKLNPLFPILLNLIILKRILTWTTVMMMNQVKNKFLPDSLSHSDVSSKDKLSEDITPYNCWKSGDL